MNPDIHRLGKSLLAGAYELRSRLFKAILALLAVFIVAGAVSEPDIHDDRHADHEGSAARFVADQQAGRGPFVTPLKATFWLALFVTMPVLLYQLWKLIDQWLPSRAANRVAVRVRERGAVLRRRGVRVLRRAADGVRLLRERGARTA